MSATRKPPPGFKSPLEDPSTPYYLHPSEGPGFQLVSHQLTISNYTSWSRDIISALTRKNKIGFIDGSLPTPPATDPITLNAWIRNSTMVFSWILNCVSEDIQSSVLYFTWAKEIWDDLKTRFQESNGPRLFKIRTSLATLSQSDQSVGDYYTRFKSLWDELSTFRTGCSCGNCNCVGIQSLNSYFQDECLMYFLMGLNDSFHAIRSQILIMDPLPQISQVSLLLVQEENKRTLSASHSTSDNLLPTTINTKPNKETPALPTHFSHPHPLKKLITDHQQTLSNSSSSCSGCNLKPSGTIYSCTTCNFFLHRECFKMPKKITHPFHKKHALTLLPKPPYTTGFYCDACTEKGKGFSYHCGPCGVDLHILCATMPLSLTSIFHNHKLHLIFRSPYPSKTFNCDVCNTRGKDHWLYRCASCGFDAHLNCAGNWNQASSIPWPQPHSFGPGPSGSVPHMQHNIGPNPGLDPSRVNGKYKILPNAFKVMKLFNDIGGSDNLSLDEAFGDGGLLYTVSSLLGD